MTVLAIDTATELLSVSLRTGETQATTTVSAGLRHAELLMPAIDQLVELLSAPRRFDLVVCMEGPGSFTGLRIGMATAKGLAEGSHCPVVSIPTLQAIAGSFRDSDTVVLPLIDARKGRFYAALFQRGRRLAEDTDATATEVLGSLREYGEVMLTGPGAFLFATATEELPESGEDGQHVGPRLQRDPLYRIGRSDILLALGLERLQERGADRDDAGPAYRRLSEAELNVP